ncbi:hypothetical protein QP164_06745 [Sphingomonas sp. LR59]|uniref:hypothetical protein n=1 Tax=Sphingomonas sp. LR59 TaxID=3050232 RepID=UPI002FDF2922
MIPSTTTPLLVTWPRTSPLASFGEKAGPAPALAAWIRVHLTYWWRHRRRLSIDRPRRFTEFVQRRKLIDRDPRIPLMIDKVGVKPFVANVLGADWVTPPSGRARYCLASSPFPPRSS